MKTIEDFLKRLPDLHEAALFLAESDSELRKLESHLASCGFKQVSSWSDIAQTLQNGDSALLSLTSQVSEETLHVLSQFQSRGGNIQVMERSSLTLFSYNYDPRFVSIVISSLREDWSKHQQQAQLLEHVGPVVSAEEFLCQQ